MLGWGRGEGKRGEGGVEACMIIEIWSHDHNDSSISVPCLIQEVGEWGEGAHMEAVLSGSGDNMMIMMSLS